MANTPAITLQPGQDVQGFIVRIAQPLAELRAAVYLLEHAATGARVLHVYCEDDENLFSVAFPTPPPDETGLPHILEHAVLAGSKKFPVREPFFEMIKISMATFINAMTGWDATYYPVSSNVKADLFNLAQVYFDAVFHPLLTEMTFRREGHHLSPVDKANPAAGLTVNGIVYNEMKGAYSHPETLLYRDTGKNLLADTVYALDSGGNPTYIPDLTYEGFRKFHADLYHPSNARFFFYGNIPTTEYLAFLAPRLAGFERREINPRIDRQERWASPRRAVEHYPIGAQEPAAQKTYLVQHWLVGDTVDARGALLLRILSLILMGNEGAPLKKAVIDSRLGQGMIYSGDLSLGQEMTFRVALRGSEADRAEAFFGLVTGTLADIAGRPIDPVRVEAAFQQAAYDFLEIRPQFPLQLMQQAFEGWLYGGDPLDYLRLGEHLRACREEYARDPMLFNKMIRRLLLDNPHRLDLVLAPDAKMQEQLDQERERRIGQRVAAMDERAKAAAIETAAELDRLAGESNTPEQLATLPQLKVRDLPPRPRHIPTTVAKVGRVDVLRNDVFANGISYLRLGIDLRGLGGELWAYLPRYCEAIGKMGAAGMNYEQVAQRMASYTGGIGCGSSFTTRAASAAEPMWGVRLGLKTLDDRIEPALSLLHDLLFGVDPRDKARLREVVTQAYNANRTNMVYSGSTVAMKHAARGLSREAHLAEIVTGLPQLALTGRLSEKFDAEADALIGKIEAIRDFLLARGRLTVSFTGSDAAYTKVHAAIESWTAAMRDQGPGAAAVDFRPLGNLREGLAAPIQVAHCIQTMPAPHFSSPDEPLMVLGSHLVRLDYMLSEIRLKGNAYGAWFNYDSLGSTLLMGSYNDPHVERTLDVFAGVRDWVAKADWTQTQIDSAIIGTAKDDERPIRPEDATDTAMFRHLAGITPALRDDRSRRMRGATAPQVKRAMLAALEQNLPHSSICVMASRERLGAANKEMPGRELEITDVL